MNEELIETQSLPKTKDRIIQFYKKNKIYVFSILFLIVLGYCLKCLLNV